MNRSPEMRATVLTLVLELMRLHGLTADDLRPPPDAAATRPCPPPTPAPAATVTPAAPPAAYGERRNAIFNLLRGAGAGGLSAAEIASRLSVPKQRVQVLMTGYRDAGYVASSGSRKQVVWTLNASRPLPKGQSNRHLDPSKPAAPAVVKPPPPAEPEPIPYAATGPGRAIAAPAPGPVLRVPGSARPRIGLLPAPRPVVDEDVIIPPGVKRTVAPPALDSRYQPSPTFTGGEFMRDWRQRRSAR